MDPLTKTLAILTAAGVAMGLLQLLARANRPRRPPFAPTRMGRISAVRLIAKWREN